MSDILLGPSYYLRFDHKLWQAMQPYPPLGTLYAAAYLRERGHDVAVFDAMLAGSEDDWKQALNRQRPRYAVIYEDNFNYLSKMCLLRMRQAAFTMIGMAREQGCIVIVAGSDATDRAGAYLARGAHYVLIGEGEHTLGALLDRLEGRSDVPVESIRGLAFQKEAESGGAVLTTPRRDDIQDLDALPFPAWDLVDMSRYKEIWLRRHGYYSTNMVTTRGCPFHCNWCAKPIWGQRYNSRRPEKVAEELVILKQTYQPDHIWYADDIMGLEPGWLLRFAELVEAHDVRLPFKCLTRADLLTRDGEIEALKRAGCQIAWLGAESGSQEILDAMEKGIQVKQIYQAARSLHAAGIQVAFFLQFGYPGETLQDIGRTLQMVRDCQPDDIGVSVSYPLPGTRFYARVQGQLGSQQNWQDSNDLAMLHGGPFATSFYRQLHTVVHKEFRARRSWAELKRWARRPGRPEKKHLRRAAAMLYHAATLPVARWRLKRLARLPHPGLDALQPGLDPQAAATPSPQRSEA